MSKELILRFGTRNLKKAQKLADKIAKRAKEAAGEGKAAVKLVSDLIAGNEGALKRAATSIEALKRRGAAIRRSVFTGGRDVTNQQLTFRTNSARFAERGLAGISAARAIAGGNLIGGASFLATFLGGPAGVVAQAATMAVEIVRPMIAKEAQRQRDLAFARIDARFDEAVRQLDLTARLREEPEFAEAQAVLFGRQVAGQAAAQARLDARRFNSDALPQRTLRPRGGLDGF